MRWIDSAVSAERTRNSGPRMLSVINCFSTTRPRLVLGCAELSVQMIELGDELVDALRNILALLIRFEQLTIEGTKLAALLIELSAQTDVLVQLALVRPHEIFDDTLQSFEVVRPVAIRAGNDIPRHPGSYR